MLQDSIVPRRIEEPWETKVQDHTWIHMLGSLSDHAQFTLDLSANPYAKVKDPIWLPSLPRVVYWQVSSYLGDQLWIWINAGAMLPLSSLLGYRDLQGQPNHHNCGALQLMFQRNLLPYDACSRFCWHVSAYLTDYMASYPTMWVTNKLAQ